MRAVRPDRVMVELDDERLGVLVDFGEQQSGQEDVLWYTEEVVLEPPLPEISGMPKSSALLQQLQAQPFFPITGQQMTEDAQVFSTFVLAPSTNALVASPGQRSARVPETARGVFQAVKQLSWACRSDYIEFW
eukprot:9450401-Pyramimonas_sp.AAC.1